MSDWKNVQYKDGKLRTSEGGGGGGSSTFAGLDDVDFSNLQNGQVPKYNSTTQKWENANESGGGGTVTDVEVDGQSVVNAQGVAEITMPSVPSDLDDLSDVDLTGLSDGDILAYQQSSGKFKPTSAPSGGGNVDDVEVNGTSVVNQNKVAKIVSYKEVTQAQYNALPASKESDGILYCISDAPSGVDGFPPLIYSEEEREIGVWRDGKPLYQKTLIIPKNIGTGNNVQYAHNIPNIDKVVGFEYGGMLSNGGIYRITYDASYRVWVHEINKTMVLWALGASIIQYLDSLFVTMQYTKTTDTAGSGQWSTDGTPTHHYSTSEKVIGTWIDGKPIYEKTLELNSPSGNGTLADLSSYSIDTIVNIRWFLYTSTGDIIYGSSSYYQVIQVYFTISSGLIKMDYNNASWATSRPMKVVIQYTKTTD